MRSSSPSSSNAVLLLASLPLTSALAFPSWTHLSSRAPTPLRRATTNTTIPTAINIAPSQYWDGDDGPWSSFALQLGQGSNAQDVRVLISTEYNNVITVAPGGCPSAYGPNCASERGEIFSPNQSLTWVDNSIFDVGLDQNLGRDINAKSGFDTVTLGWQGSDAPSEGHTVVFNTLSPEYWLGIFGLRPIPTNFTTYVDPQPAFLSQLVVNSKIPSLSWAYTAGNQYRLDKVYGSLVLGGYDTSRFAATNLTFPFYEDNSRELLVNIQSITSDTGSTTNLLPDGSIAVVLDSSVAMLYLPVSACRAFEKAFGLTYDGSFYLVNTTLHETLLQTNANVTFTLGPQTTGGQTVDIVLPYGAFDLQLDFPNVENPNTSYYFPLAQAANESQYTLGRTFFQEAYVIADHDRRNFTVAPCTWNASQIGNANIVSILRANETAALRHQQSKSSGLSAGAIGGIVVGGVVGVIAAIAVVFMYFFYNRREHKRQLAELEAKTADAKLADGSGASDAEAKPFITDGELADDGQIHELTAPHKAAAAEMDSPHKFADPNRHGYAEMAGGDYFGPGGKGPNSGAAEVHGSTPIYEMPGSDVHEMAAPDPRPEEK